MFDCEKCEVFFCGILRHFTKQICVVKITQGGAVAAPVAGKILSEVLPYMEIEKQEEAKKENVVVPNVVGMTVKEAKKTLEELGLQIKINKSEEEIDEKSVVITEQTPKEGIRQEKNGYIICEVN